ncbi:MAG: VWA domain-containing protein [Bryobacteraceae bacterium]
MTVTLALITIIPMVGLGVDLSMLYLTKAKLLAATDAAVLAGARALSQGSDAAAQRLSAQNAATKFFYANWPLGFWGTTNLNFPTPVVDDTSIPNYRTITATASVQAPVFFLAVFGGSYSTVVVSAQAARRDALVVLVLDRSSSMTRTVAGTGRTACAIMKDDAIEFVKYFAQGRDMVGLVTFNSGQFTYQARTNFNTPDGSGNTVSSLINQIVCNSNTASAEAMRAAYQELVRVNSTTRLNVIVFMTDGIPNGVTGDFVNYRLRPAYCDTNSRPLIGVLAQWFNNQPGVGTTAGLLARTQTSVTVDGVASTENSGGCIFAGDLSNPGDDQPTKVGQDISRMPPNDVYGNALAGTYSTYSNPYVTWFGSAADLTRVDIPREITKASANALDNQATAIRSDTTLKPAIYTIGLNTDPTGGDVPDEQLLMKIANDPMLATAPGAGPTFYTQQQNQPRGIYVNAPDATQLQSAFTTIATHIVVRLSR